jgi:hypothetical protein
LSAAPSALTDVSARGAIARADARAGHYSSDAVGWVWVLAVSR